LPFFPGFAPYLPRKPQVTNEQGFSNCLCRGLVLSVQSAQNYDESSHFQWLVGEFYVDIYVIPCFTYPVWMFWGYILGAMMKLCYIKTAS